MPLLDTLLDRARLLDAVDLALHLDHRLYRELADLAMVAANRSVELGYEPERVPAVAQLDRLLDDAGSAYQVHWSPPTPVMLVRRVDPTAAAALEHARTPAPEPAGQLLDQAWRQVHRRDPDPTAGYATAVRAVEQVICPLMLPDDHTATRGKVPTHLRQGGHKWRFVLVDRDGTDTVALPASDRPRLSRRRDSIKGFTTTSTLAPLLDRLGEQRSAH
jgi:hypothetical protein